MTYNELIRRAMTHALAAEGNLANYTKILADLSPDRPIDVEALATSGPMILARATAEAVTSSAFTALAAARMIEMRGPS